MTKINYKEKKLLSLEEKDSQELSYMVDSTKLQLQSDILATRSALNKAQCALKDALTNYPLDSKKVIECQL